MRWILRAVSGGVLTIVLLFGFSVVEVLWLRLFDPPGTLTMVQRAIEQTRTTGRPSWPDRRVRSLEALGETVPRAVLSAEDARFYLHDGFDWDSVCTAVHDRVTGRRSRLRGASTISQQTAKNLFLWQGRSWIRKGIEVYYTVLIELLLPKDRILELYLNVAETGPMVFGVEAGAMHHFGRPAARLDANQAGLLAGILPDPRNRSVQGRAARERAAFIRSNPAPIPGDPKWDIVLRSWEREGHGPFSCLGR